MNIRFVRLRTHQRNIDRYEDMLKTKSTPKSDLWKSACLKSVWR